MVVSHCVNFFMQCNVGDGWDRKGDNSLTARLSPLGQSLELFGLVGSPVSDIVDVARLASHKGSDGELWLREGRAKAFTIVFNV